MSNPLYAGGGTAINPGGASGAAGYGGAAQMPGLYGTPSLAGQGTNLPTFTGQGQNLGPIPQLGENLNDTFPQVPETASGINWTALKWALLIGGAAALLAELTG